MKFKCFSYGSVKSTNSSAMYLIKKKNYHNGFILATSQKKGRGRHGKKWISKKGNFFSTIFFQIKKNYPTVEQFTIINSLLNIDVIKNYCGKNKINFKPPNDILVNNKKICGILQEVITKDKNKYLIVGIGINLVTNPKIKKYISTNIYKETNIKPDLNKISEQVLKKYENFFKNIKKYSFSKFKLKSKKLALC